MDPRDLIITPEDETGGRQRRFFGWLIWGLGALLVVGLLLWLGMVWQAAIFVAVAGAISVGGWLLFRWAGRGLG